MQQNRKIIYLAGFIFSVSIALMSYINSSFLSTFVEERFVGLIYTLGSIISILSLLIIPKIFSKIGLYKFLLFVIGLDALSILFFAFAGNVGAAILLFISGFALNTLIVFSLDELLKIFSKDSATGKIRGAYLALCNLAWVVAQIASSTILGNFPFQTIYIVSFVIMLLFLIVSFMSFAHISEPEYDKIKTAGYIKRFLKNRNLLRAYGINFLLQFFYVWMIIYTPIYLYAHLHFSWTEISTIFAIMLLPFVIIQAPLGIYSDKIGERKILMLGFTIMSLATLSIFFINIHAVWIWAMLLFMTRIGAATIEVMSDVYFFKHIKPENEELIGIYRSATPVSYIIGPAIALIVFYFIPSFNFIYIVLGTIMLCGIYLSSTIRKSDI